MIILNAIENYEYIYINAATLITTDILYQT